ncbi:hypothetical protein AHF37_05761 [Paragonimus kellicotti]|nr:hypothetical protein AHF37_05761 [Paragonimus kellicotti]
MTNQSDQTNELMIRELCRILEVQADVTVQDLKKAYYRLAKRFHPDKNPSDAFATNQFILVSSAYQTLRSELTLDGIPNTEQVTNVNQKKTVLLSVYLFCSNQDLNCAHCVHETNVLSTFTALATCGLFESTHTNYRTELSYKNQPLSFLVSSISSPVCSRRASSAQKPTNTDTTLSQASKHEASKTPRHKYEGIQIDELLAHLFQTNFNTITTKTGELRLVSSTL